MRRLVSGALELVYPKHCLICHQILNHGSHAWLCEKCHDNNPMLTMTLCKKCGQPLNSVEERYCFDCHRTRHYFNEGRALWVYEGHIKERIKDMKYSHKTYYGEVFGALMADYFKAHLNWQIDVVISVPIHRKKLIKRGFNQADLIAKHFAKKADLEYRPEVILRSKFSKPQKALTDIERKDNVMNAFAYGETIPKYDIIDKSILIIDDIYTTGSTVDGIAKVLKAVGAREIYCLTVAIGKGLS